MLIGTSNLSNQIVTVAEKLDKYIDEGYVKMANPQYGGVPEWAKQGVFQEAIEELMRLVKGNTGNIRDVMVNTMPAEKVLPAHRDYLEDSPLQGKHPTLKRYHLVLKGNDYCYWWDKVTGMVKFEQGNWYGPVPYWNLHTFINAGHTERINLIIDLDCTERLGNYD